MKTLIQPKSRRHRDGFFLVVVLLAVVSLLLVYVMANVRRLEALRQELRQVETRQIQRVGLQTNVVNPANIPSLPK